MSTTKVKTAEDLQAQYKEDKAKHVGMEHYFEKWRNHMTRKAGEPCGVDCFDEEFSRFETQYFGGLPAPVRMTTEMLMPINQRMMACVWYTE